MKPINSKVFIIVDDSQEKTTATGIILTGKDASTSSKAVIYAIGDNEWGLKPGDEILFSRYSPEDVNFELEPGKPIKGLKSIHIDSIDAIL